ncbi:MAG: spore coat polysaccharide biosynthesis protein F [Rhodospirillaceae bacterium]|nr:MAG: spore coat polysaccharide biosynthesis protein F [Rhodospirillaceae bacterium]
MKRDVIIQARLGSVRLPKKVLFPLEGQTILAHVIKRALRIPGVNDVCVAIPDDPAQQPIADEAERAGAVVFKGSEDDVLGRYYFAAKELKSDVVTRITADCPLFDPTTSGAIIALLDHTGADYACNNMPLTWPHGTETETFTFEALKTCQDRAQTAFEREHVTVLMRYDEDVHRVNLLSDTPSWINLRWTLDYPEDYTFLKEVFQLAGPNGPASLEETTALLAKHPEITAINAHHGHYEAEEPEVTGYRVVATAPFQFEQV